jgi:hypothetical protein
MAYSEEMAAKRTLPEPEIYTPERIAEFLLTGAVDEEDYQDACETVREMGLDAEKIEHLRAFEL